MKIERKKKKSYTGQEIFGAYWRAALRDICGEIRDIKCNGLYCNGVLFIKCLLKLYDEMILFCERFNVFIDLNDVILNEYSGKILDVYDHVIYKHEYLYKNISYCVF